MKKYLFLLMIPLVSLFSKPYHYTCVAWKYHVGDKTYKFADDEIKNIGIYKFTYDPITKTLTSSIDGDYKFLGISRKSKLDIFKHGIYKVVINYEEVNEKIQSIGIIEPRRKDGKTSWMELGCKVSTNPQK